MYWSMTRHFGDCYINDYLHNEENKNLMNFDANSFCGLALSR